MKKVLFLVCLLSCSLTALAEEFVLTAPKLEPKLTYGNMTTGSTDLKLEVPATETMTSADAWKPDFDFFKSKTNVGVKPYKFMDDMTFVGVPLFLAGMAIKGDKAMFAQNNKEGKKNTQLLSDFKTGIDDYSQYFGPAMTVGLKLAGYEGRSDWPRLFASAAMSYGIMAALVNGIKYTAKEMRPDGSQANSWPSGHTATSFVGATLLHKEYGLTRSPWFSVAGYGVATATGVMRVLNNRHWVSDVMSGAGIGILSTELGYALGDLLFKGKGLLRNDLEVDSENPSFFGISMGVGLGNMNIEFEDELIKENIKFRSATVVDAEGAYFINKYVGIGGRFRVRAMSAKSFGDYAGSAYLEDWNAWTMLEDVYRVADKNFVDGNEWEYNLDYLAKLGFISNDFMNEAPVTDIGGVVKSDHLAEFTGSVGLYFNIPLSKRLSIGTKFLVGRSITQELDIDGYAKGNVKNIEHQISFKNGEIVTVFDGQGRERLPGYDKENPENYVKYPVNTPDHQTFYEEWDYLTLGANNSTSYGTGLSLTYRYKSNFSWKLYCDYDYTKKSYTLKYDPFHFMRAGLTNESYRLMQALAEQADPFAPYEFKREKKMNYFTLGLSFLVNL